MIKYFFIAILSFNILSANENVVKTSELELFLFKVGFESLLKDVDLTKDKSKLNEQEIKSINEKIELIMSELYKDKRVLLNDSNEDINNSNINNDELKSMKKEITFLKEEILKLKKLKETPKEIVKKEPKKVEKPKVVKPKVELIEKIVEVEKKETPIINKEAIQMRVATALLAVYELPNTDAAVIRKIKKDNIIQIKDCKNGWCKLFDKNHYVRRYLIKPWKM